MSDINFIPEAVAAVPAADVSVEVIAELTSVPAVEIPNVSVADAVAPSRSTTSAPTVAVSDLHHIHSGFLQVSVREGVARLEALIAKLEG
jgi:hypothetical protein